MEERIELDKIQDAPYNPRQIGDEEMSRLKASIWSHTEALEGWNKEDGYRLVDPVIVNKFNNRLCAGHQRIRALRELKQPWIHVSDVRWVNIKNERKEAALNIALNNTKMQGEWDFPKLKDLVAEIDLGDFDFGEFTGFDMDDLGSMFGGGAPAVKEGLTDPDAVPKEPKKPRTVKGDLYELGNHRLLCGDNRTKTEVERLVCRESMSLCHTDPPYGINATQMTMGSGESSKPKTQRLSNDKKWDGTRPDILWLLGAAEWICVWGGNYFADVLKTTNHWLCWYKKNDNLSFSEFELAWTNYGKQARHFEHHWGSEKKEHLTQKPMAVVDFAIDKCPEKTGNVLDPFMGSGTTIIACERVGRKCFGMEISELYCDVAIQRWVNFTGETKIKLNGEEIEWPAS